MAAWFTPTTKPWELVADARDALRGDPPPPPQSEWIVDEYFAQTEEATIWAHRPVLFPESAQAMKAHFAEFDPRKTHFYRKSAVKLWIPQLNEEAPLYVRTRVEVIGRVQTANVLWPLQPPLVEWIIQLKPITSHAGLVYCRVTRSVAVRPVPGEHYVVSGLVIAAGAIKLQDGGSSNATYLACSSVRRPYGRIGRFTRLIELTGINVPTLREKSRSEKDFERRFNREVERAVEEDPSLKDKLARLPDELA